MPGKCWKGDLDEYSNFEIDCFLIKGGGEIEYSENLWIISFCQQGIEGKNNKDIRTIKESQRSTGRETFC